MKNNTKKIHSLEEFIGVVEAAKILGISKKTLYTLTSKKMVPHYKRGKLYFRKTELLAWIEHRRIKRPSLIEREARQIEAKFKARPK